MRDLFAGRGAEIEIVHPDESADLTTIARRAAAQATDVVVAGGGDGTISCVAFSASIRTSIFSRQTRNGFAGSNSGATIAALVVLAIGATRVYLGAHYLSDVLAAFAAGAAWLAFCWTITETLRRRHQRRRAGVTMSPSPPRP
ncbi:MAG: phosphatase PAP2 family protein [Chthoniobacterales bacterium]|nr:phosphatase PAP2 family protein [Chthoniobacterales bacterium]